VRSLLGYIYISFRLPFVTTLNLGAPMDVTGGVEVERVGGVLAVRLCRARLCYMRAGLGYPNVPCVVAVMLMHRLEIPSCLVGHQSC